MNEMINNVVYNLLRDFSRLTYVLSATILSIKAIIIIINEQTIINYS